MTVISETSIVATRIADCSVLVVPDSLDEHRLRQLEEVVRRGVAAASLRSMVFDMSALKYADMFEFRELMALADTLTILSIEPLMVGLNPGIIMHWVASGADCGRVRTFLDLADALNALGLTMERPKP